MSDKNKNMQFKKSVDWDSENKPITPEHRKQFPQDNSKNKALLEQRNKAKLELINKYNMSESEAEQTLRNIEKKARNKRAKKKTYEQERRVEQNQPNFHKKTISPEQQRRQYKKEQRRIAEEEINKQKALQEKREEVEKLEIQKQKESVKQESIKEKENKPTQTEKPKENKPTQTEKPKESSQNNENKSNDNINNLGDIFEKPKDDKKEIKKEEPKEIKKEEPKITKKEEPKISKKEEPKITKEEPEETKSKKEKIKGIIPKIGKKEEKVDEIIPEYINGEKVGEIIPEHAKGNTDDKQHSNVDDIISTIIPDSEKEICIEVKDVSLSFEVATEKIDNLKELFIRTLKRNKGKVTKFQALKDINFNIYKGEKIGIIGYNGAGKSTLLNVITGIYPPDTGEVKTYGRISPLLALGAGFDHNYSGRENIYLNGAIMGYSKKFLESKYDEIVEFSELEEFIDFPVKNYSSGMMAKLGFSIATIVEPDILIIDEVLGVGDVNFQKKSSDKIRSLMDAGTTVLLVSHSIPQIRKLCEKAIWIDKGQVREIGEVNDVCNHYLKDAEKATKDQLKDIRFR